MERIPSEEKKNPSQSEETVLLGILVDEESERSYSKDVKTLVPPGAVESYTEHTGLRR